MKQKRLLAGGVTILGVALIWAVAANRQDDQTRALARQWVGEQWDVARRCIVGTQSSARSAATTSPPTSSAMAPSTWFQMSVCSPGVHGIAPLGSCIAAIDRAVSATWAAVSTPGRAAR